MEEYDGEIFLTKPKRPYKARRAPGEPSRRRKEMRASSAAFQTPTLSKGQ